VDLLIGSVATESGLRSRIPGAIAGAAGSRGPGHWAGVGPAKAQTPDSSEAAIDPFLCLIHSMISTETTKAGRPDPIIQFSVFTPNRLGRLHDLVRLFAAQGVTVLALMVLDTTDSAIIRLVVSDPDNAREVLLKEGFPFTESNLVVVEANATDLGRLMSVLLAAELNINYLYSFIPHPHGKSILALSMEDNEVAEQALRQNQFRPLRQVDISR
jgi:hypothetical protein